MVRNGSKRDRGAVRPGGKPSGAKGCFSRILRTFEWSLYLVALALGSGAIILAILFSLYGRDLPSLDPLLTYNSTSGTEARWSQSTQVLAADGTVIGEFYDEDRVIIGINQIPMVMRQAIIAVEDERFDPAHPTGWVRRAGIDPIGIARAAVVNILARRTVQGGSTITQQLAKNLFLTRERTLRRKIQEMIIAYRIEKAFHRDEIMERYLNKVFFGNHAYGVHSAASRYFGVDLSKPGATLSIGQAAMLAGLAKAPSAYAPHRHRDRAEARLKIVLQRMVECGYLPADQLQPAFDEFWRTFDPEKVTVPEGDTDAGQIKVRQAGFFVEYVRQEVLKHIDVESLNKGGFRIETTLDPRMQAAAEAAMTAGLARLTADLTARRINLTKGPLEGALVAMDHTNGHILAMVGGSEWSGSNQFNRAVQAHRQAGSAFKPLVYWTALDQQKATLGSVLRDQTFQVPGTDWSPKNYDGSQRGPVLPRTALTHSLNIAAVRMLLLTSPEEVIARIHDKLGINTSNMQPYPSIVLGAFEVTLLEMVSAYSAFANLGERYTPGAVLRILDKDGRVVRSFVGQNGKYASQRAMEPGVAYLMTSTMQSVVQRGTAASAVGARIGRIPAAGKTGTTDDYADAWFVGYTPTITAGVWVGFDERRTMGRGMTGGRTAGTIWSDFIVKALAGKPPGAFPAPPSDVIAVTICSLSGLRASPDCPNPISEYFIDQTSPSAICTVHSDPTALEEFLYGADAPPDTETAAIRWPDQPSYGFDTAGLAASRDRLRAIIDAEAPAPQPVPSSPQ